MLLNHPRGDQNMISRLRKRFTGRWPEIWLKIKIKLLLWQTCVSLLPPEELVFRVNGNWGSLHFLKVGRRTRQDMAAALHEIGRDLHSFRSILDFGCGCGRVLIWMRGKRATRLYGLDIDRDAVEWCRRNIPFAEVATNEPLPPLPHAAGTFDLVYAISVFTHINEEFQFRWLAELRRVLKPGGILLVTLHGGHCSQELGQEVAAQVEKQGFLFAETDYWKGIFPDWYQNAYHTEEYVRREFGRYFEVLSYRPRGLANYQDMALLRKKE